MIYSKNDNNIAIAMDYLDSYHTFYDFLSSMHSDKDKDAWKDAKGFKYMIARNLCAAVQELHQVGIMHGDLAGENVLVKI